MDNTIWGWFPKIIVALKTNKTIVFLLVFSILLIFVGLIIQHNLSTVIVLTGILGFIMAGGSIFLSNSPKKEEKPMPPTHTDNISFKILGHFKLILFLATLITILFVFFQALTSLLPEPLQLLVWALFILFLIAAAWEILTAYKKKGTP